MIHRNKHGQVSGWIPQDQFDRYCKSGDDGVNSQHIKEQLRTLRGKLKSAVSDAQAALRAVEESIEQFNKTT